MNPYEPPTTVQSQSAFRTEAGSPAISVVSAIAAMAFIAFAIALLRSTPGDRKAGMLFLVNVPVLIAVAVSAIQSTRRSAYFAFSAAGVQIAIAIALLVMTVGDAVLVIGINFIIVLPCLAIAMWAWRSAGRYAEAMSQSGG